MEKWPRGGKFRIYPESDTHFFLRGLNIQLEFEDNDTKAQRFVFIQDRERHEAER